MEKIWRNLIVVVVVLVVLFVVYLAFSPKESSLDRGYEELYALFEKNNVSVENIQLLDALSFSEKGEVVWVEDKQDLIDLRFALVDFNNSGVMEFSNVDERDELRSIVRVYISAVDYILDSEPFLERVSTFSKNWFDCDNTAEIMDLNKAVFENYEKLNLLADVSSEYVLYYDLLSNPIDIDLEYEKQNALGISSMIQETLDSCNGVVFE